MAPRIPGPPRRIDRVGRQRGSTRRGPKAEFNAADDELGTPALLVQSHLRVMGEPRLDEVANLVVAFVFAVVYRALALSGDSVSDPERLVLVIVILNVTLAFFNILPIPPLDGYNFAMAFLPFRLALQVQQLAQYGLLVLLGLVLLSRLAPGASPLDWLFTGADGLARLLTGA